MQTAPATTARSMIYKLLDDAAESYEPIQITGKRSSAVLIAEDGWRVIQERKISSDGRSEGWTSQVLRPLAISSSQKALFH